MQSVRQRLTKDYRKPVIGRPRGKATVKTNASDKAAQSYSKHKGGRPRKLPPRLPRPPPASASAAADVTTAFPTSTSSSGVGAITAVPLPKSISEELASGGGGRQLRSRRAEGHGGLIFHIDDINTLAPSVPKVVAHTRLSPSIVQMLNIPSPLLPPPPPLVTAHGNRGKATQSPLRSPARPCLLARMSTVSHVSSPNKSIVDTESFPLLDVNARTGAATASITIPQPPLVVLHDVNAYTNVTFTITCTNQSWTGTFWWRNLVAASSILKHAVDASSSTPFPFPSASSCPDVDADAVPLRPPLLSSSARSPRRNPKRGRPITATEMLRGDLIHESDEDIEDENDNGNMKGIDSFEVDANERIEQARLEVRRSNDNANSLSSCLSSSSSAVCSGLESSLRAHDLSPRYCTPSPKKRTRRDACLSAAARDAIHHSPTVPHDSATSSLPVPSLLPLLRPRMPLVDEPNIADLLQPLLSPSPPPPPVPPLMFPEGFPAMDLAEIERDAKISGALALAGPSATLEHVEALLACHEGFPAFVEGLLAKIYPRVGSLANQVRSCGAGGMEGWRNSNHKGFAHALISRDIAYMCLEADERRAGIAVGSTLAYAVQCQRAPLINRIRQLQIQTEMYQARTAKLTSTNLDLRRSNRVLIDHKASTKSTSTHTLPSTSATVSAACAPADATTATAPQMTCLCLRPSAGGVPSLIPSFAARLLPQRIPALYLNPGDPLLPLTC